MIEYSLDEYIPLIREVIESDGEFRLYPRGTSMLPLLRQGVDSVALVSADKIRRGDILLYRRANGQYVLHRLVRARRDGSLVFSGDNHLAFERDIARDQVIASVAAVFRGDKRKDIGLFTMKLYSWFMTTRPGKLTTLFCFRVGRKLFGAKKV